MALARNGGGRGLTIIGMLAICADFSDLLPTITRVEMHMSGGCNR
jgi:hypothetical protein